MALADTARLIASLELQDKFSATANKYDKTLVGLDRRTTQLSRGGEQVGHGLRQVGTGLTTLGTRAALLAAGGLTAVIKTAVDFESAFAGVTKTVEGTPAQLEELNQGFRELARTIPLSFEEFAAIGEQAGALGIAREDILAFTEVVAKIGTTTDVTSDEAATALGQLSNVLKLSADDFDNFGAALVDLGNKGASTESAILAITSRAGAGAKLIGLTADQTLAWASAVANLGVEAEAGGSALQQFALQSAKNLESTEDLATMAKTAGTTGAAFKKAFEKDASGALQTFLAGLGKLKRSEQLQVLDDLGLDGIRLQRVLLGLAGDNDNLTESLDNSKKAWQDNTALNKEAEKRYATTAAALAIVKNNLRDAANTIGSELLPVIRDLSTEFVDFLNQKETQRNIKEFAQNLGELARTLVTDFKAGKFDPLIENLKGAAGFAKTAFDAFNALPGPIKQVLIAGAVANRVTGGAVGLLAAGGANILKGLIGIGGGLLGRGATPATPLFTKEVGLGGLGGPGGGLGGGGFGAGVLKGAALVFGAAAAAELGNVLGHTFFFDPTVKPAVEFETSQFDRLVKAAEGDPLRLQHGIDAIQSGLDDLPPLAHLFAHDQVAELERQRAVLESLLVAAKASARDAGDEAHVPSWVHDQTDATAANTAALKDLTLEQRLLRDKEFKPKLDTSEFIRLLRRTSEFGAKSRGTSIEQGPRTGRDPVGDAFVALVNRLEKPALKSNEVQGEIRRHIKALEEVQGRLLREGNIADAKHAQRNIDALHRILGTSDETNALLRFLRREQNSALSVANRRLADGNARQRDIAQRIAEQRDATRTGFQSSNAQLGVIARKDFSPTVNVNLPPPVVAISDIVRASVTYNAATSWTSQTRNGFLR